MIDNLKQLLLDVVPDPTPMERFKKNPWPLLIAAAAFVGLIVWYYRRLRKKKSGGEPGPGK